MKSNWASPSRSSELVSTKMTAKPARALAAFVLTVGATSACSDPFDPDCSTYLVADGTMHAIESEKLPGKRVDAYAAPSYNPEGIALNVGGQRTVLNEESPRTVYPLGSNVDIQFTFVEAPFEGESYRPYVHAECISPKPA